jgi:predicted kinase
MELVVFIGLPASGKSSFYRQRFSSTHALVSKDRMSRTSSACTYAAGRGACAAK